MKIGTMVMERAPQKLGVDDKLIASSNRGPRAQRGGRAGWAGAPSQ
jgi:hypothetical protein